MNFSTQCYLSSVGVLLNNRPIASNLDGQIRKLLENFQCIVKEREKLVSSIVIRLVIVFIVIFIAVVPATLGRSERADELDGVNGGHDIGRTRVASAQLVEYAERMTGVVLPRARERARRCNEGACRVVHAVGQDLHLPMQGYRDQPTARPQYAM